MAEVREDPTAAPVRETPPTTLVELLQRRAAASGASRLYTFLLDSGEEDALSYQDLDRRARSIAAALQQRLAPGERAVLLCPPGPDYIAGFFGCLYAGVVAVPAYPPNPARLDRTLPRLRNILRDAQVSAILTLARIHAAAEAAPELLAGISALQWFAVDDLAVGAEAWRPRALSADSLAFLQYTSGSTGSPKGVVLTHDNLLENLRAIAGAFELNTKSSGVLWLPPYHDMGLIGGILAPVFCGFEMALLSPEAFVARPLRWLEAISERRATAAGGPDFAFDFCARRVSAEDLRRLDLSSWELAFCGSEPIRAQTLDRFAEVFAPCGFRRQAFYPCYGLAEATLLVSGIDRSRPYTVHALDAAALSHNRAVRVEPGSPGAAAHVGCGHSQPGHEIAIVDPETLEPRSAGEVGEIWVRGPSVARGYWQKPEETEQTFGARPRHGGGGPYLRTGDLGLLLEDGELIVTGRLKDVLIIRGANYHPQDLELTVGRCHSMLRPGRAVVFPMGAPEGERVAVAAEVQAQLATSPEDPVFEEIAASVRRAIAAEHDLSIEWIALLPPGAVPRTSSGKLQRRACRAALQAGTAQPLWQSTLRSSNSVRNTAPGTEAERRLCEILAEVLGVPAVGMEADFFALGGDSLLASQVAARLRSDLQVELAVSALFELRTAAAIAAHIEEGHRLRGAGAGREARPVAVAAAAPPPALVRRREQREGLPLSFAQQRLWFLNQFSPGTAAYNVPAGLRLSGQLHVEAMRRAFEEIVCRHESLRTTFGVEDGRPVQRIRPAGRWELAVTDLSAVPHEVIGTVVQELATREARRPFDLQSGPLLRTGLLRLSAEQHVLLLCMHHIVSDGWSMGVLVREMTALYRAFREERSSPLPELPIQYADFALWQRASLTPEATANHVEHWKKRLAGAPALALPADRPRPTTSSGRGVSRQFALRRDTMERLQQVGIDQGATLFMVLLAAFETLLHRWTGQADFCVGTPVANRTRSQLEPLIGFFVNTLVIRADLSGDPSFLDLLHRVRQTALDAYARQDLPFERLVEALGVERQGGRSPLVQAMFTLQNAPDLPSLPALESELMMLDTGTSKFEVTLSVMKWNGEFVGILEYDADLFDPAAMERLTVRFEALVEAVAADPARRLSTLPFGDGGAGAACQARSEQPTPTDPADGAGRGQPMIVPAEFVAPRTLIEESLAAIWREVLSIDRVGIHDDFFRLGGTSLSSVLAVARIQERLGIELSLPQFFECPSIARLASLLQGGTAATTLDSIPAKGSSPVVLLSSGGPRRPLFLVHAIASDVLCYAELARGLRADRPIYGLQSPAAEASAAAGTIESMASGYLAAIHAVQPAGPYLLGGWSMGGVIAYEMARQMEAQGEQVALLALIDANAHVVGDGLRAPELERDATAAADFERRSPDAQMRAFASLVEKRLRAVREYVLRPYGGPVVLLRPSNPSSAVERREENGWGPLARAGVEVHEVAGDHLTMLRPPDVEHLAARLRSLLARAP